MGGLVQLLLWVQSGDMQGPENHTFGQLEAGV